LQRLARRAETEHRRDIVDGRAKHVSVDRPAGVLECGVSCRARAAAGKCRFGCVACCWSRLDRV